jgi:hypothetical protein
MPNKPMTHIAWGYHRVLGRRGSSSGYWVEIGKGRHGDDSDGHEDLIYLDRTPIGGWGGAIRLRLIGSGPPNVIPQRPGQPLQPDDGDTPEE